MSSTKRAALYVRVSTDAQTLENQIRELRQVAGRRGWDVVEVYSDAGKKVNGRITKKSPYRGAHIKSSATEAKWQCWLSAKLV